MATPRAAATDGGLCFFHANPSKVSELGRIGGRSRHKRAAENCDPLPTVDNAVAVRDTVARLIADVYAGKLQPKVAAGLAPLMNLQLRAIEATNWEQRLAKLEKLLAETGAAGDLHHNRGRQNLSSISHRGNLEKASDGKRDVQSTLGPAGGEEQSFGRMPSASKP